MRFEAERIASSKVMWDQKFAECMEKSEYLGLEKVVYRIRVSSVREYLVVFGITL